MEILIRFSDSYEKPTGILRLHDWFINPNGIC